MGTAASAAAVPGYMTLYDFLPGWDALRTPGRLVIWTTLLLGILAAGAVSAFVEQAKELSLPSGSPRAASGWLRAGHADPAAAGPRRGPEHHPAPGGAQPAGRAGARSQGPLLVLPSDQLRDEHVMLWMTDRFQPIVNGGSGFTPNRTQRGPRG